MRRGVLIASALFWLVVWVRLGGKPTRPAPLVPSPEPVMESPVVKRTAPPPPLVVVGAQMLPVSHQLTLNHGHLARVQELLGALHDALDLTDAARLRALLERYDGLEPEDPQRLHEGYERIADCLEAEDDEARADARANAERYYQQARASVLRRHVRRQCLEAREEL